MWQFIAIHTFLIVFIPFLESVMTPCQKAQKNSSSLPFGDSHLIRCKQDGSYEEVQCSGSTGFCWCVDEKGFQLNGTKTRGPLKCPSLGLYTALSAYVYNLISTSLPLPRRRLGTISRCTPTWNIVSLVSN